MQGGDTDNKPPHRFWWGNFSNAVGLSGDAYYWKATATKLKADRHDRYGRPWRVDNTPARGAVAWYASPQHVAIVTGIYTDGTGDIAVDQYNADLHGSPSHARRHRADAYLQIEDLDAPQPPKSTDLNHDGLVNIFDLSIMLSAYGKPATFSINAANSDVNRDGTVNIYDLSILLSHYGTPSSAAAHTAGAGDGLSSITLTADRATLDPGQQVTLTVALDAGEPTNGVRAQIAYPAGQLAVVDADVDPTWGIDASVTSTPGVLTIDAGDSTPLDGPQPLATIRLRAIAGGPAPVTLTARSSVIAAATNEETLADTHHARLTVNGPPPVGGGGDQQPYTPLDRTAVAHQLLHRIAPPRRSRTAHVLLRHRRYRARLSAPAAGVTAIRWRWQPHGRRSLLVAAGSTTSRGAGPATVTVRLTRRGARLLRRHTPVRLTARGTFTPDSGEPPITAVTRFRVKAR